MAVNFDPSQLTPEQRQTWEMQQELQRIQENGNRMQMLMQHQIQQQKERFEMLSNTLKAMGDSKGNTIANMK
jgi:exonuclease VII large subunit